MNVSNIVRPTALLLIILAYVFFVLRLFFFIAQHSENLLFWDEWDTVDSVIYQNDIGKLFRYQENEHRIGTGLILIKLLAQSTRWNTVVEVYGIGILLCIVTIISLFLKARIFGGLNYFDVIIPTIFLNTFQIENLLQGFQLTFILPLVFFLISLFILTLTESRTKRLVLLFMTLLSAYASFHGLFIGFIVGLYYALLVIKNGKISPGYGFVIVGVLAIIASYFINFNFQVSFFRLPSAWLVIPAYMANQINSFLGLWSEGIYRWIILVVSIICFMFLLKLMISRKMSFRKLFVILALFLYSFWFGISTAFGRWHFGVEQAHNTRYVTHMVPLFFGMYLTLQLIRNVFIRRTILLTYICVVIYFTQHDQWRVQYEADQYKQGISMWRNCYLQEKDAVACNRLIEFRIFPEDRINFLQEKLNELEEKKLNLFAYEVK